MWKQGFWSGTHPTATPRNSGRFENLTKLYFHCGWCQRTIMGQMAWVVQNSRKTVYRWTKYLNMSGCSYFWVFALDVPYNWMLSPLILGTYMSSPCLLQVFIKYHLGEGYPDHHTQNHNSRSSQAFPIPFCFVPSTLSHSYHIK